MNNDILQRYIEGNSSQQEKEEVAKWIDADDKNRQEFMLLRSIYDATLWNENNYAYPEHKKSKKIVKELLKVAAVFLVGVLCCHLFFLSKSRTALPGIALQTITSPEGQRAKVVLSDGTHIWLNANSSLSFPAEFSGDDRIVELNGEAYFDVKHDDTKRFIVDTKDHRIIVYGTEFNVNAYHNNNEFEAALIDGSLEVVPNTTHKGVMLSPNNKLYTQNNQLILGNIETYDQFLWKEGILYFERLSVKEIFGKLELYYDVNITVKNEEILNHQYTGKFWTRDGVEHVLRVLQLRHTFKYIKDDMNNITIY